MTVSSFVHDALPARIVFGQGTLRLLPEETDRLNLERVLVVSTVEQKDQANEIAERQIGRAHV